MEEDQIQKIMEMVRKGDDHVRALVLALVTVLEHQKVISRAEVFAEYDKILRGRTQPDNSKDD